jgi:hypothetical protein
MGEGRDVAGAVVFGDGLHALLSLLGEEHERGVTVGGEQVRLGGVAALESSGRSPRLP